jgi:hypothetical protein
MAVKSVITLATSASVSGLTQTQLNGTAHFKKCEQLFEYQHLPLLRDSWWSKF